MNILSTGLYKILERPLLSALLAGSLINGMQWWLLLAFSGEDSVNLKWHDSLQHPVLSIILFLIPYLVPFTVTTLARKLSEQKIQSVLNQFPESNPDVVMRFDAQMQLEYINPVGRQWLETHQLDLADIHSLLPNELLFAFKTNTRNAIIEGEKRFNHAMMHYKAKADVNGEWMITARDITPLKTLQESLDNTLNELNQLNEFLAQNLNEYEPKDFDIFINFAAMLEHIVTQSNDSKHLPDFIFCTFTQASKSNQTVWGQIYKIESNRIFTVCKPFELENNGYAYAISKGSEKVVTESWDSKKQSLEAFQEKFNPKVRELVGNILSYATYQSGSVAVIGFFQNRQPNHAFQHLLKQVAVIAHSFQRISQESEAIYGQFVYSLKALARASEANDEDTGEHILRINEYAYVLAQALEQPQEFCDEIRLTAMMHDVGKIHLDPHILKKPGALSAQERKIMQQHPQHGANILGDSDKMKMAREICLYHHEKYDGTGYPFGLQAKQIPLAARIVGLVDVYDALRQKRVYKPSFTHEEAVNIITQGDGRTRPEEFDPELLEVFKQVHHQFNQIFRDSATLESCLKM